MEETWEKMKKRLEMGENVERELLSMNLYALKSLISNFNFFNEMPSIFQDRLEAFDVVERRTKDMAEQLEAKTGAVARIPENVTPWDRDWHHQNDSLHEHLWPSMMFQLISKWFPVYVNAWGQNSQSMIQRIW